MLVYIIYGDSIGLAYREQGLSFQNYMRIEDLAVNLYLVFGYCNGRSDVILSCQDARSGDAYSHHHDQTAYLQSFHSSFHIICVFTTPCRIR